MKVKIFVIYFIIFVLQEQPYLTTSFFLFYMLNNEPTFFFKFTVRNSVERDTNENSRLFWL